MIVMKFGGSSLANAERIGCVRDIVASYRERAPVVVLSAMGDTTDHLLEAAEKAVCEGPLTVAKSLETLTEVHLNAALALGLSRGVPDDVRPLLADLGALLAGLSLIRELSPKMKDFLVSFGERLSVRIAAAHFQKTGLNACCMDAWDAGIISDSNAGFAEIEPESYTTVPEKILPLVKNGIVPVITGYIAKDRNGVITTLGRGGSDLSATFIAAACRAEEVQVWKDVDGVLTADPRIVPDAMTLAEIDYEEAAELAYFGAQVLHPRAMQPCIKNGIAVQVKNSYAPKMPGTRIVSKVKTKRSPVRSITMRKNVTLVDITSSRMLGQSGFLAELFASFAKYGISVDMIATSEVSVSITLDSTYNLEKLKKELDRIAAVKIKSGKAIVSIICNVKQSAEILQQVAGVCVRIGVGIQMVSQGASKVNISFIVDDTEAENVVINLHGEFFG